MTAIKLPTNEHLPYNPSYWSSVVEVISKLKENPSVELLLDTLVHFINKSNRLYFQNEKFSEELTASVEIFKVDDLTTLREVILQNDVIERLPTICSIALEMPLLFPSKELKILKASVNDSVVLNRRHIACLVAHMFFCTLLPSSHMKLEYCGQFVGDNSKNGPLTFSHWYTSHSNPTKLYVQALMNYFEDISTSMNNESFSTQTVMFNRNQLDRFPRWEESTVKLAKIDLTLTGSIGDIEGHVEMDFANKNVGFGTTGTQEELLLGVSIESCTVALFTETLKPDETLSIQGIKKYANFTGYGSHVNYIELPKKEWIWQQRKILAIDANEYIGDEKVQLRNVHLQRELNKIFCGFSTVPNEVIDTGHWGCGVFGGNKGIKALLQLMAASEAHVQLKFYTFGDSIFHGHFEACLKLFEEKQDLTVADLWKYLKAYEKDLRREWVDDGIINDVGILVWLQEKLE